MEWKDNPQFMHEDARVGEYLLEAYANGDYRILIDNGMFFEVIENENAKDVLDDFDPLMGIREAESAAEKAIDRILGKTASRKTASVPSLSEFEQEGDFYFYDDGDKVYTITGRPFSWSIKDAQYNTIEHSDRSFIGFDTAQEAYNDMVNNHSASRKTAINKTLFWSGVQNDGDVEYLTAIGATGIEYSIEVDWNARELEAVLNADGMPVTSASVQEEYDLDKQQVQINEAIAKMEERAEVYEIEKLTGTTFPRDYWGNPITGSKTASRPFGKLLDVIDNYLFQIYGGAKELDIESDGSIGFVANDGNFIESHIDVNASDRNIISQIKGIMDENGYSPSYTQPIEHLEDPKTYMDWIKSAGKKASVKTARTVPYNRTITVGFDGGQDTAYGEVRVNETGHVFWNFDRGGDGETSQPDVDSAIDEAVTLLDAAMDNWVAEVISDGAKVLSDSRSTILWTGGDKLASKKAFINGEDYQGPGLYTFRAWNIEEDRYVFPQQPAARWIEDKLDFEEAAFDNPDWETVAVYYGDGDTPNDPNIRTSSKKIATVIMTDLYNNNPNYYEDMDEAKSAALNKFKKQVPFASQEPVVTEIPRENGIIQINVDTDSTQMSWLVNIDPFKQEAYDDMANNRSASRKTADVEDDYELLHILAKELDDWFNFGRDNDYLRQGDVESQIARMRQIYNRLDMKPEWLTEQDLDDYAHRTGVVTASKTAAPYLDWVPYCNTWSAETFMYDFFIDGTSGQYIAVVTGQGYNNQVNFNSEVSATETFATLREAQDYCQAFEDGDRVASRKQAGAFGIDFVIDIAGDPVYSGDSVVNPENGRCFQVTGLNDGMVWFKGEDGGIYNDTLEGFGRTFRLDY